MAELRQIDIDLRKSFVDQSFNKLSEAEKAGYEKTLDGIDSSLTAASYADDVMYTSTYAEMHTDSSARIDALESNAVSHSDIPNRLNYTDIRYDMERADKVYLEAEEGVQKWFDGTLSKVGGKGSLEDMLALQNTALAEGKDEIAALYQEDIDSLQDAKAKRDTAHNIGNKQKEEIEHLITGNNATIALSEAYTSKDNEAIQVATDNYLRWEITDFERNSATMSAGINSQADADAYKAKLAEITKYKDLLGIKEPVAEQESDEVYGPVAPAVLGATTAVATPVVNKAPVSDKPYMPPGMSTADYAKYCATTKNVVAQNAQNTKTVDVEAVDPLVFVKPEQPPGMPSDAYALYCKGKEDEHNAKIASMSEVKVVTEVKDATIVNPYAFEKPDRPADMSADDYEKYCVDKEAEHVASINAGVADDIWIKGKWGNGQERIDGLTAAGYDVSAIQGILNDKVAGIKQNAIPVPTSEALSPSLVPVTPVPVTAPVVAARQLVSNDNSNNVLSNTPVQPTRVLVVEESVLSANNSAPLVNDVADLSSHSVDTVELSPQPVSNATLDIDTEIKTDDKKAKTSSRFDSIINDEVVNSINSKSQSSYEAACD